MSSVEGFMTLIIGGVGIINDDGIAGKSRRGIGGGDVLVL